MKSCSGECMSSVQSSLPCADHAGCSLPRRSPCFTPATSALITYPGEKQLVCRLMSSEELDHPLFKSIIRLCITK